MEAGEAMTSDAVIDVQIAELRQVIALLEARIEELLAREKGIQPDGRDVTASRPSTSALSKKRSGTCRSSRLSYADYASLARAAAKLPIAASSTHCRGDYFFLLASRLLRSQS